jgi:hypothetical protein
MNYTKDLSAETLQVRKEWDDIVKVLKEKEVLLTKNTILFKNKGEIVFHK